MQTEDEMIGQNVNIPAGEGTTMAGYLARPEEGSGAHSGIIVLHEVFGLTPEVKRVTSLVASAGYVGLAIDLYHRTHPQLNAPYTDEGNQLATQAASHVTASNLNADVRAAMAWLEAQPFVRRGRIATWGFGFGATGAFVTSGIAQLRGAICFYPAHIVTPMPSGGPPPIDFAGDVAVPLLLCFGDRDYYVSRYDMDRIGSALRSAHKQFHMQIYPNVGHSFFRHGRAEAVTEHHKYSDQAIAHSVADSWDLVRAFLRDVFNSARPLAGESGEIRTERTQVNR